MRRYPSMCWYELRRSFSRELFCRSLQRLVPEIQPADLATGGSGVRAQAIAPEGELVQDFRLIARPNALHVLNAPSPAATASLAIGAEIVDNDHGGRSAPAPRVHGALRQGTRVTSMHPKTAMESSSPRCM